MAATQSLAVTVITSSTRDHKVGEHLTFDLYVVKGDKLADPAFPQLNPRILHKGAMVTVQTSDECKHAGHKDCIFTCVVPGCSLHPENARRDTLK